MSKFYHLNAKASWKSYRSNRIQVVKLYNSFSPLANLAHETPELKIEDLSKPTLLHFFGKKGVAGGLLVEQLMNNESVALITFMALAKENQSNGLGTELVNFAKSFLAQQSITIVGVQLNPTDGKQFWMKQGFTDTIPFGNGLALIIPE